MTSSKTSLMLAVVLACCVILMVELRFTIVFRSLSHKTLPYLYSIVDSTKRHLPLDGEAAVRHVKNVLDVHLEDGVHGHTFETVGHHLDSQNVPNNSVAIACAVISGRIGGNLNLSPIFRTFLPSFCKTASPAFSYHFYFSFDNNDAYFKNPANQQQYQQKLAGYIKQHSPKIQIRVHWVQCAHSHHPAWAQNDAAFDAYLDNIPYIYRINDDTSFMTSGWPEAFVDTLARYSPPNVGVVGPHHQGGNMAVMTYDFTHKTHIDVFGFHYPRTFSDWWADDWITLVYRPGRSTKLMNMRLTHTMEAGTRYKVRANMAGALAKRLVNDKKTLIRYIKAYDANKGFLKQDATKVVAMSLYRKNPVYTYGAIRNAQLMPVVYPGWSLRVYVPAKDAEPSLQVPPRVIAKLLNMTVQVARVPAKSPLPPKLWSLLALDDTEKLSTVLIRDAHRRISDREAAAVRDWLNRKEPLHTIRDLPAHTSQYIVRPLIGARVKELRTLVHGPMSSHLNNVDKNSDKALADMLSRLVGKDKVLVHDSVSCKSWRKAGGMTVPFPVKWPRGEAAGMAYDQFNTPLPGDVTQLKRVQYDQSCVQPARAPVPSTPPAPPPLRQLKHKPRILEVTSDERWIRDFKRVMIPLGATFVKFNISRVTSQISDLEGRNVTQNKSSVFADVKSDDVTHILCAAPVSTCQVFSGANKPVLLLITDRFDRGIHTQHRWNNWIKFLETISKSHQNLVVTSSTLDRDYTRYYTGVSPIILPPAALYVGKQYAPDDAKPFLVYGLNSNAKFKEWFRVNMLKNTPKEGGATFEFIDELYLNSVNESELVTHPGVIWFAEHATNLKFIELYRASMPILSPSQKLLLHFRKEFAFAPGMLLNHQPIQSVSDISKEYTKPAQDRTLQNPVLNAQAWWSKCDVFLLNHVTHFDNLTHLTSLMHNDELLIDVSQKMTVQNARDRELLHKHWKKIIAEKFS